VVRDLPLCTGNRLIVLPSQGFDNSPPWRYGVPVFPLVPLHLFLFLYFLVDVRFWAFPP